MLNVLSPGLIGLLFDIVGVVVLGRAFAFVRNEQLLRQSGTYWNGNDALLKALIEQRFDARYGLAMLLVGFVLQGIGTIGTTLANGVSYGLYFLFMVAVLAWLPVAKRRVGREFSTLKSQERPEKDIA